MSSIDRVQPPTTPATRPSESEAAAPAPAEAARLGSLFKAPLAIADSFANVATGAVKGTVNTAVSLGSHTQAIADLRLPIPWLGKGEQDKIGWIQDAFPPAKEATAEFETINRAVAAGESVLPDEAKDHVYLAVGGLLSDLAPKQLYFDDNLDALEAQGLTVGRVPVDTDMGVEHNAAIVREAVMKAAAEGKQVVLIGHSKGGLDSAAALAMYPEIQEHVRALVTVQSPYGGSPMANDLLKVPLLKPILGGAVEILGGSIQAGIDLTYDSRKEFLAKYPMPEGIPTVSMASTSYKPTSPVFATQEYMQQRYGVRSDGLVVPEDAFLPGSKAVLLTGMDHLESTVTNPNPFKPYNPADMTVSLVAMALATPKEPAQA